MIRLLRTLQYHLKMCLVGLWCAISTIVFYLLSFPFNRRKWLAWAYAQMLNFGVRLILGVKVEVLGRENMIAGPAMVTMNHQSNFDPLLQGPVFPKNAIIIGKKELLKIPLWGRLFKASNNILVDRGERSNKSDQQDAREKTAGVDQAIHRLKDDDCYIWIFPEGTRSQGSKMGQFKRGAFIMAIEAQVPIIPMISKPLKYVLDVPNKLAVGGKHQIKILPPVATAGMTLDDLPALIAKFEQLYAASMAKYLNCSIDEVFA
ncbi:MAG: 1-acyl-sn-glycerol-3-phosphate acyltransferase [Cryomorphaceae bacterium]|jgi:1-acyl-sn-glycerol-3-phosphate acyltransferase